MCYFTRLTVEQYSEIMTNFLEQIEQRVRDLLSGYPSKSLSEASRDNCSEVSRLVGCWIQEQEPEAVMTILKGEDVCDKHTAHDLLAVRLKKTTYLLDPTIWQFFPDSQSILMGEGPTLADALELAKDQYGGTWSLSEDFDANVYSQDTLQEIVLKNISLPSL